MYHVLDFDLNASEENDNPTPLVMTKRRHRKSVHKVLQDDERSNFTTSLDKLELLCSAADREKRRITKRSDTVMLLSSKVL